MLRGGRGNIAHVEGRVEETLHMLMGGWENIVHVEGRVGKHCTC